MFFRIFTALLLLLRPMAISQERTSVHLQEEVERAMAGQRGALVVIDVVSGKILAESHLAIAAQRLELPGSTVKPFVLMELLNTGKVDPEKRLMCRRPLTIGGKRMDCTHPPSIGTLNASEAIAYSCNSYFAAVAAQLTGAELAEVYRRAGFTVPTGLAPNEAQGNVTQAGELWQLQLQALGEWGVQVTPLELLAAYRNLALQKLRSNDLGKTAPLFAGLELAVKYGMAHGAQVQGIAVAGKTGTASGIATPQSHGFFVGYAPAEKPEIVVMAYLERGRGMDAAAVAKMVFAAYGGRR